MISLFHYTDGNNGWNLCSSPQAAVGLCSHETASMETAPVATMKYCYEYENIDHWAGIGQQDVYKIYEVQTLMGNRLS